MTILELERRTFDGVPNGLYELLRRCKLYDWLTDWISCCPSKGSIAVDISCLSNLSLRQLKREQYVPVISCNLSECRIMSIALAFGAFHLRTDIFVPQLFAGEDVCRL